MFWKVRVGVNDFWEDNRPIAWLMLFAVFFVIVFLLCFVRFAVSSCATGRPYRGET